VCVRAVSDFTSGHVQCIFALSDTGSSSGSDSTFTLAVPAITLSHRRLTCALAPWLSTTQGIVTFRLFRGIGSFSKIHTSGGTQGAGVILDVPGDERYSWTEVQRTENGQDILATGITFTFLQVWQSIKPTRAAIGDGTVIYVTGFGFSTSAKYACAFSSLGTGNISGYDAEHQAVAVVTNSTHLTCSPSTHIGEETFPLALISLLTSVGETVSIRKDGPPSSFQFLPAFTSISPTSAAANQNFLLSKNTRAPQAKLAAYALVLWTYACMYSTSADKHAHTHHHRQCA